MFYICMCFIFSHSQWFVLEGITVTNVGMFELYLSIYMPVIVHWVCSDSMIIYYYVGLYKHCSTISLSILLSCSVYLYMCEWSSIAEAPSLKCQFFWHLFVFNSWLLFTMGLQTSSFLPRHEKLSALVELLLYNIKPCNYCILCNIEYWCDLIDCCADLQGWI